MLFAMLAYGADLVPTPDTLIPLSIFRVAKLLHTSFLRNTHF